MELGALGASLSLSSGIMREELGERREFTRWVVAGIGGKSRDFRGGGIGPREGGSSGRSEIGGCEVCREGEVEWVEVEVNGSGLGLTESGWRVGPCFYPDFETGGLDNEI